MLANINAPLSYLNWQAELSGQPWQRIFEFPLFSDAHFVGEITEGGGPYQIINTLSMGSERSALILRVKSFADFQTPNMNKTQDAHYHGGTEVDEIAALVSLWLGVRLKAGGANRIFDRDSDPMGSPISLPFYEDPIISAAKPLYKRAILPSALGQHSLQEASLLCSFPMLQISDAISLVRAARMYQEAIWIIETAPELSWIMLTSAVEAAASKWRTETETAINLLRAWGPGRNIENILRSAENGEELLLQVAEQTVPIIGSRKTFRNFILEFLPPAPQIRPPISAQISWEKSALKRIIDRVYDYRSRALHGGIPFQPLCAKLHSI
jgi:hypothetical protein